MDKRIPKKKKIHLVSRCAWTLYNFRAGLVHELKKMNYHVKCGAASDGNFEKKISDLDVTFTNLPVSKRGIDPYADLLLFLHLYKWYRSEKPDIVHHFTIKPVIYGSLAAKLAGIPKIINTVTGLGFVFTKDNKMPFLLDLVKWQYRLALALSDFTFFLNQEDLNIFRTKKLVSENKSGLLPGEGIDCTYFSPRLNNRAASDKRFVFLMLARMLWNKGVKEFVDAARILKKKFPHIEYQLLGAGDERNPDSVPDSTLESWHQEGIIKWLGNVSDVRPMIADSDAVVLPSCYREGIPRSLLEGAAMSKPLITTDTVGCRDVVEHGVNGFIVPVRDSSSLADAMTTMIENREKSINMGIVARKKVKKEYSESIVFQKILDVYKK